MVNYSCPICEKIFTQKGHLEAHQTRKRPCKKNNTIEALVEQKVKEVLSAPKQDLPIIESKPLDIDYTKKTREELIVICKEKDIKGYSGKKKSDIITLLNSLQPSNTIIYPINLSVEGNTVVYPNIETSTSLRFIDLFCGIGGFHEALDSVIPSAKCVMASDIDIKAQKSYEANHKILPIGDITKIDISKIPAFDLLCGGFPCQAFSIAQWKDKKAFDDPRGTLFFEILKIIDYHKPKCLLLENVAHLTKINGGDVFKTIVNSLTTRGYKVSHQLLSPHQFGVPQNRERVYIVATLGEMSFNFTALSKCSSTTKLSDILETTVDESYYIDPDKYTILDQANIKQQAKSGLIFCGYLKGELRKVGARENTEHLSRVHKQLMRIYSSNGTHPTLAASETSGRYHIYEERTKRVRRLTLNECYRLMAYPDTFKIHENKGVAYKQIGNSVCVKVVKEIIQEMKKQKLL